MRGGCRSLLAVGENRKDRDIERDHRQQSGQARAKKGGAAGDEQDEGRPDQDPGRDIPRSEFGFPRLNRVLWHEM